jgi:hypothetical protein
VHFLQAIVVVELIAAIAFLAGWLVFRRTRSAALGVAAGLLLAIAPWWDGVPGAYAYLTHVRTDGGTRIIQTTESRDYLYIAETPLPDAAIAVQSCLASRHCYEGLFDRRQTVELRIGAGPDTATRIARLSIATMPDPQCDPLAEYNRSRSVRYQTLGPTECLAIAEITAPASRFDVRTENSDLGRLTYVLERTRESVAERAPRKVIAERVDYEFSTWPDAPWPALRLHLAPPPLDIGAVLAMPR